MAAIAISDCVNLLMKHYPLHICLFTDNISSQLLYLVDNHNIIIIRNTNFQIYPGEGHFLEGALEHYYETIEDFLGSCFRTIEKQEEQDFLDNFIAFR